jgi:hypothetical protein
MKKSLLVLVFLLAFITTATAQFIQNFDAGTTTPAGWGIINGGDVNTWKFGPPNFSTPYNGANVAKISFSSAAAHDDYLVTPLITVVAGVNDQLSFRVNNGLSNNVEHFDVKIATSAPTNAASFTTTIMPDTAAPNVWSKVSLDLTPYVGQSIYIGFHATSINMYELLIDNVVSEPLSVCLTSTGITENFDTNTTLPNCWSVINDGDGYTWSVGTPVSGTAHSGTNVVQIPTGTSAHDDYLITPKMHVVAGVNDRVSFWVEGLFAAYHEHFDVKLSNTYTLSSSFTTTLLPDTVATTTWTKYTLDLSAFAGQNVYVGFHAVSTNQYYLLLDDIVIDGLPQLPPFPQDFDLTNSVPNQWSILNTSGGNAWKFPTTTATGAAYTGTNIAQLTTNQSATVNDFLVTPAITVVAGVNDRFSFKVKRSFSNAGVYTKISTTSNASYTNFTIDAQRTVTALSGWEFYDLDLTAYVGQTIYIGLGAQSSSTGTLVSFDNIILTRKIPTLNSNCNGYYDLTSQNPYLLNGSNPAQNTITFYLNEASAIQGTNPITPSNNVSIYSSSGAPTIVYAKIYNTISNTYTITYFYLINKAVTFQFQVTNYDVTVNIGNQSAGDTLQWFLDGNILPGETSTALNTLPLPIFGYNMVRIENTSTQGCTSASGNVPIIRLVDDAFTVNMSNGVTATTPSILDNDFLYAINPNTANCTMYSGIPGITMSQNGIISVAPSVAPGQYMFSCTVTLFDGTFNAFYMLNQMVTVIIPVNGIRMNAFIDNNNNGYKDAGEVDFPKGKFKYIVNNNGVNNVIISPVGLCTIYDTGFSNSYDLSYEIDTEFLSNYSFANISFNDVTIAGTGIQYYNFPITTISNYNDLSVTIVPSGNPRPGFHYVNKIAYTNNGTQTIASGTVTFTKGTGATISSVSEPGIVSTTNGFTFGFTNLLPFETRYITVDLLTATIPTVTLGQLITNSASITMVTNDVLPLNNSYALNQIVVGSYDPNQKSEGYGDKILYANFSANDYLTYTIEFENTGTDYASFINVTDVLDAKLDESSIRMLDASHVYTLKRVGSNLTWNFANINLPPSVSGTEIGKGYVTFKIKPKAGYAVGDIIPNSANIYFDYNPAIVTNTWTTQFVSSLNNESYAFNGLNYYPNPVKNNLTISNSSELTQVEITSVLGQTMMTKNLNELQTEIDLSNLENGVYFVKVKSDGAEKTFSIVKK